VKILHIVAGDLSGGAARGAFWLHEGLKSQNINSKILLQGQGNHKDIIQIKQSSILKRLKKRLQSRLDAFFINVYTKRKKIIFSTGRIGYDITKLPEYHDADIIHLHWINNILSIKDIRKIKKPIVWTMRDMWPMTGGCHVATALDCENYKTGCGHCKQLMSEKKYDLSTFVLSKKKKYFPTTMKIIGISTWLTEEAKKSQLFKNHDVRMIPNNINVKDFFPIQKEIAKTVLGIQTDKKIILLGSTNLHDPWKGYNKYLEAIELIDKEKYFLCFFGQVDQITIEKLGFEYKNFGFMYDNVSIRTIYSCADVFVAPSLMEAFGKTIAESMSCETPVVCFDATGPKDIVDHKRNGYLATPYDSKDLANGIEWVLNADNYKELCQHARNKVLKTFDSQIIAKQYIELYKEILHG